jgi:hypothetical protein
MLKLEAGGFVIKITSGVYRVADYSGIPKESFRPPKDEETFGMPKESYGMPKTEQILESASNKKSFGIPKESSAPPKETFGMPKVPVNVVNVNLTNKQTNVTKIKSTDEITAIIGKMENSDAAAKYVQKCFVIENMLKSSISGISRDVISRIVIAEKVIGKEISIDLLNDWRKEAINAEKSGRVKQAYMAFAKSVKTFYEANGVKWTKCRPNNLREIQRQIDMIETLNTPITVQGKSTGETVASYISNGQVSKIDAKEVAHLLDPPLDPPPPLKKPKIRTKAT